MNAFLMRRQLASSLLIPPVQIPFQIFPRLSALIQSKHGGPGSFARRFSSLSISTLERGWLNREQLAESLFAQDGMAGGPVKRRTLFSMLAQFINEPTLAATTNMEPTPGINMSFRFPGAVVPPPPPK